MAKDTGADEPAPARRRPEQIWCAIDALAAELPAWMQLLALADQPAGNPSGSATGFTPSAQRSPEAPDNNGPLRRATTPG